MTETFREIIHFIKNPALEKDPNPNFNYRFRNFRHILAINFISSFLLAMIIGILTLTNMVSIESHAMEDIMDKYSFSFVFFLTVTVAPNYLKKLFSELL